MRATGRTLGWTNTPARDKSLEDFTRSRASSTEIVLRLWRYAKANARTAQNSPVHGITVLHFVKWQLHN
jgi:hypothetical protein